jgi:hypothetical protein
MKKATAGCTVKLLWHINLDVVITKTLCLDLNGFRVEGTLTVADNCILYGMDSQTDDFTVADGNYGSITVASGTVASSFTAADGRRYVTVAENDSVSFHRLDMRLNTISLRASTAGFYYTAIYNCDEVLEACVNAWGVAVSVTGMPDTDFAAKGTCHTRTEGAFTGGMQSTSCSLFGILKDTCTAEENDTRARITVYANAYLELADGTVLMADQTAGDTVGGDFDGVAFSLYDLMLLLDETYPQLSQQTQLQLDRFYTQWKDLGMQTWPLTNIKETHIS